MPQKWQFPRQNGTVNGIQFNIYFNFVYNSKCYIIILSQMEEVVNKKMGKFYNIALDLGTNSVGWAAVGSDFKVIKKGDNHLWGVVLFDEGKSAKDRRMARSARRRYERRRKRVELLRSLMVESVSQVDPDFFRKLDSSFLLVNTKDSNSSRDNHYNIFNGEFTDKDYYKKYKTVYHLRKALMDSDEKADIRLVYLAIHHIIKYRGNFLHDEESITITGSGVVSLLQDVFDSACVFSDDLANVDAKKFYDILSDKTKPKKDRQKAMIEYLGKSELAKGLVTLLLGYKLKDTDVNKAFSLKKEEETDLQFGTDSTEEQLNALIPFLSEEQKDFLDKTYAAFYENTFINILGEGNGCVSDCMISRYNEHNSDLKLLKSVLGRGTDEYKAMFKSPRKVKLSKAEEEANKKILNYVKYVNTNTKRTRATSSCTQEDFYGYVKKVLGGLDDSEGKAEILSKIELETFMPKINDVSNGYIPYQFNKNELEAILEKQSRYYPELAKNKTKILSLLTFRRPYSVGVLKGPFSWIDQNIDSYVAPWNFSEKVDYDVANSNFIKRMLSKDPFFEEEYVLPKESITYQKYVVLNELNNIRLKEKPLDVKLKQRLFDELVCKKVSVTKADILKFLETYYKGLNVSFNENDIKLADEKLLGTMRTYIDFKKIFGDDYDENDVRLYDKIVECISIFNDKKVRASVLDKLFEHKPKLKKYTGILCKKNYSKWGKYSYRTLCEELSNEALPRNIMNILYETQRNITEILYGEEFGFAERTVNKSVKVTLNYENLIENLYANAAVRKTVWQAYKVVKEIIDIVGNEPEHIFFETTREPEAKKKKDSRKKMLDDLYKDIKTDVEEYNNSLATTNKEKSKIDESRFSEEKVFLYFLQMGRCMYSGQKLSLDHLSEYEVDHVVPRSYINDDSLDNKVLVLREENQRKRDLAISDSIRSKMAPFWAFLKDHKLMSSKKYNNLQKGEYNENDLKGFINRQLVETTQANACFASVIKAAFAEKGEDFVLPIRAKLSSEFRNKMEKEDAIEYGSFIKVRSLNDFHHAKDAYLAAVLGTFTTKYYPMWGKDEKVYFAKQLMENIESDEEYRKKAKERYGFIIDLLKDGNYRPENAAGEHIPVQQAFGNVCRQMDYNDIKVVRAKEMQASSSFYDENPLRAGKSSIPLRYIKNGEGKLVPLDPEKYGGYNGEQNAYFVWISYTKGKKTERRLVGIPALVAAQSQNQGQTVIENYVKGQFLNANIEGKPVYKYQLIKMNGQLVYISSDTEVQNATQLIVNKKYYYLLKCAERTKAEVDKRLGKKNDLSQYKSIKLFTDEKEAQLNDLAVDFVKEYVGKLDSYYGMYGPIAKKVKEFAANRFNDLDITSKLIYVYYLLIVTKAGAGRIDMPKEWNGGSSWGRLKVSTIDPNEIILINQSICGYYKK